MQAIITKYLSPSNVRGARIRAKCSRGGVIISFDDAVSVEQNHLDAAQLLIQKFVKQDQKKYGTQRNPWQAPRAHGQLPSGEYVHCFIEQTKP